MIQPIESTHYTSDEGNPTGGFATAKGISIVWQDGPLGRGEDRQEPNGAFVETVIAIAIDRLEFYQVSRFACNDNQAAIEALHKALWLLNNRTAAREQRGVEGTHEV